VLALLVGCAREPTRWAAGPVDIELSPRMTLKVPRHLAYLPPEEGLKLMHALGERPGAEVLGVLVTRSDAVPRMMVIFATGRDAQGNPEIELAGWDEVPAVRSLINEMLIARERI
jgi:uncharacterized membrane-anchored protein